jgi:DNA-binding NtrC family response regulator
MVLGEHTQDDRDQTTGAPDVPVPGVVLVFTGGRPVLRAIPLRHGAVLLGRDDAGGEPLPDERASRVHAEVGFDGLRWSVRDTGSRNGTFVDGRHVGTILVGEQLRVLRIGHSVFVLRADVRPYTEGGVRAGGDVVVGPILGAVLERVRRAAVTGDYLLVQGESGSGKELAARSYHDASASSQGPFVAVNCAAIPEGVAERLLFGARRGAFSGATADADGYLQAADGGTLFLDEIGELDLNVQAKLLRVLETREVMPLGASKPRAVSLRVCSATHRDLRLAVAEGRFRQDLYFRIGRPVVALPALRERPEEIPWLIELAAKQATSTGSFTGRELGLGGKLVEACVLRPWPGNVRELVAEVRRACQEALAANQAVVGAEHLGDNAGTLFERASAAAPAPGAAAAPSSQPSPARAAAPTREEVEAALASSHGNVAAASRALGMHRTQLYRVLKRLGVPLRDDEAEAGAGAVDDEE